MNSRRFIRLPRRQWRAGSAEYQFLSALFSKDVHAKRVYSLANATLGVSSASLAVNTIGQGHVAEDGPTAFAHACRLGAEGIVSKKVDGTYRSGPSRAWIKVRNPASIAVQRERSENWNR
jgi:hypothetical protein